MHLQRCRTGPTSRGWLAVGLCLLLTGCSPPPTPAAIRQGWQSSESRILDRHGALLQSARMDAVQRRLDWVSLAAISPPLIDAVLRAEDQHFQQHHGVDWPALADALLDTAGGDRRGASTISMQLAGLLDPRWRAIGGQRNAWQKLGQLQAALRLEASWSKQQILEAYLNLAPFRGELVGIDAASRLLLGKAPASLDRQDSLLLASLLRAPNADPASVARRACQLASLQALATPCPAIRAGVLAALAAPGQPPSNPDLAPELIALLQPAAGQTLRSSLDAPLQAWLRQQLRDQLAQLAGRNVRDGAAVVLANDTGEVLAWVGSPGAGGSARHVDAVLAPRQAGSTLKPLLYELALERQLLTAASLLDDSPLALATPAGQYVPQNYDHRFRGPVSVRTALAGSQNVPAVRSLLLVGLDDFHARLTALGLALPYPAAHYGYALALGGAEVRLIDLANAYRSLARQGRVGPWRLTVGQQAAPDRPLLSPAASWLVGDILADRLARAGAFGLDNPLATPYWAAVKTGTSKDMRDNWAVGFSRHYTVAVWVGNADGEPMWDVSGVSGAAPLWRAIVNRLADTGPAPPVPAGIDSARIRYQPAVEAPRREYFLAGTAVDKIELADGAGPAIVYPGNGQVVALDPEIPVRHQRVWFRARGANGLSWQLNGRRLGRAEQEYGWFPLPGGQRLALIDRRGQEKSVIQFQVRGVAGR